MKNFSHSMDPYLRKLGLQTELYNGEINLLENYLLAEEGKPLNTE